MGILEVGGAVCRKEGEMKGHVVTAAFPGMHHAQTSGTKPLNDVIVQGVGKLPVRFHSLFATKPRNSSKSEHSCQTETGCLHQVTFLLRRFTDK